MIGLYSLLPEACICRTVAVKPSQRSAAATVSKNAPVPPYTSISRGLSWITQLSDGVSTELRAIQSEQHRAMVLKLDLWQKKPRPIADVILDSTVSVLDTQPDIMIDHLPVDEPRYVISSLQENTGGISRKKVVMALWTPDDSCPYSKTTYASFAVPVKSKLGISTTLQQWSTVEEAWEELT